MRLLGRFLRGDTPQLNTPVLDRRRWPRSETPFDEAAMTWNERWAERRMEVRVVNLSQGGAGLIVPLVPPADAVLNLVVNGRDGPAAVEGKAVASREDLGTGWFFLHMKFIRACPEHVLDRMRYDSEDD